jgi:hypothetical protein
VVVDDVDLHGDAALVRFIDEMLEGVRATVSLLDGKEGDRIVTPAVPAVEPADRHEGDHVHSEVVQVIEPLRRIVESRRFPVVGPRIVEGPDVQFIHDDFVGERRLEALVFPDEGILVINHGGLASVGQGADFARPRVLAPEFGAVGCGDDVFVGVAGARPRNGRAPHIVRRIFGQGIRRRAPIVELARHGNPDRIG